MKSLFRWLLGFEFKTTLGPIVVWAMASAMLGWSGNKDGTKTYHVEVRTAKGLVEGHEASPAGDYKKRRQPIGTLTKDGAFKTGK